MAKSSAEHARARDRISELVSQVMDGTVVMSNNLSATIDARAAGLNRMISAQLSAVMHAPEFTEAGTQLDRLGVSVEEHRHRYPASRSACSTRPTSGWARIGKNLTDNGSQFTARFDTKAKKPSGKHAFDVARAAVPAEHRLALQCHPQTNGMVERFDGRIYELIQQTRFDCRADLQATLMDYAKLYNHHISVACIRRANAYPRAQ